MDAKFRFLGGAEDIGRMGMTIDVGGARFLVEYGMSPEKPPQVPLEAGRVDRAFLTHSHLDHCGMMPSVCSRGTTELFTTPLTAEVGEILMYDSLKIAKAEGYPQNYTTGDIEKTMDSVVPLSFGDVIEVDGIEVETHPAGHIPGAAMFEYRSDVSTLYTGDIHTVPTSLVKGAEPVDCTNLFIEGTYGGRRHRNRHEEERRLINRVHEVIDRGGTVVIPSFAIGRTQEIMCMLSGLNYEMWVDGMGRSVSRLYSYYKEYLDDKGKLRKARRRFNEVRNSGMRTRAARAEIIVTTGGMLDGGPVLGYLDRLKDDPKSAVFLVGFQAEDTNGRMLVETGAININGQMTKIECELDRFDFSAHADHGQIVDFVRGCDPDNVILMHSDTRDLFLDDLADYNVILPETGKEFTLNV
ncbi:MAG: MBL fold metallo-hydrolase [Thermoplasmatales archaeon]|nr:MBL fold metallo-hydrolase [Thermoplasmatales archaeon]